MDHFDQFLAKTTEMIKIESLHLRKIVVLCAPVCTTQRAQKTVKAHLLLRLPLSRSFGVRNCGNLPRCVSNGGHFRHYSVMYIERKEPSFNLLLDSVRPKLYCFGLKVFSTKSLKF